MLMLLVIVLLVIMPVAVGYIFFKLIETGDELELQKVPVSKVAVGDRIVYTKTKFSSLPCARAHDISASERGENYTYLVDKYWVVANILNDGRVVAKTRRGKLNYVAAGDPNMRKAKLRESLFHRNLFPVLAEAA